MQQAAASAEAELKALSASHSQDAHVSMQRLKGAEERVKELHSLLLQRTHDSEVRETFRQGRGSPYILHTTYIASSCLGTDTFAQTKCYYT